MGSVIFLLLCALVFRALATTPTRQAVSGPWWQVVEVWAADIVDGARALARLDAARREELGGRPWR